MARQSNTPVQFNLTRREDTTVLMSSGRAGKVVPAAYIPLLRGDSASGKIGIDIELAEMPRPLLNGATANFQAWFVPKSAHPQFSGMDEFLHSYMNEPIKALGAGDRTPPTFFPAVNIGLGDFGKTLGWHKPAGVKVNPDVLDAFSLVYNFRLAAHSSKLPKRPYVLENAAAAIALPRAFWPSSYLNRIVPDYERALVVGALDLDVAAGQLPIRGLFPDPNTAARTGTVANSESAATQARDNLKALYTTADVSPDGVRSIFADMEGQAVGITLADIDKARETQAFAKLRAAYAGNDIDAYNVDDVIVAHLMQGLSVPDDEFRRPWLLDSKRVGVGFAERHATDGTNLDKSVTQGRASAMLSLNVPRNDVGGIIIVTVEVVPERLDERQSDEFLWLESVDSLPNALRDVQRIEPVDLVKNRRIDAKHTSPDALYGYEPMNDVWNRRFTRLGGVFYQETPGADFKEQRSALWLANMVDPTFNDTHYLVPNNLSHSVFADTMAPAFEFVARHQVQIVGLTQFGDVLAENNDDFEAVQEA